MVATLNHQSVPGANVGLTVLGTGKEKKTID